MEIVMHTFPATNVTPEYTHPAVQSAEEGPGVVWAMGVG
jgi:hypothetical protein